MRLKALGFESINQPIVKPMKPPKFPMKFKDFLRRMFGGRLHADRLHMFRKYLVYQTEGAVDLRNLSPEARDVEVSKRVDDLIAVLNREGMHQIPYGFFNERIPEWRKYNRLIQRRTASKSRWEKEKQKKILQLPKAVETVISHNKKYSLASLKAKKVTGSHPKK